MAKTPKTPKKRTLMSDEHKKALAEGREQGRAVRAYLEALDRNKPKRGRKRTTESVRRRLETIATQIPESDPLTKLHLIQERMDLEVELETMGQAVDLSALEEDFVSTAKDYGRRKGVAYAAWRELGVAPEVLKKAGIGRGA
jgi:hypothetical protein